MNITPFATTTETITIDQSVIERYGLDSWAAGFALGTAGYRDLLDPADFFSPAVPFNGITMALIAHARGDLFNQLGLTSLHIGGEVRPHTGTLINLFSRIYAAKGIHCHLTPGEDATTPIWLSSFGVFHYGLGGGENFTASHSPSYKGGWKPMDNKGMQLMDMADKISRRVKLLVQEAHHSPLSITLAPSNSPLIHHDFEPTEAYVKALNSILPAGATDAIRSALDRGLKVAISTEGGSMGRAARAIFGRLDFPMDDHGITLLHEEVSDNYHGIGVFNGENHGVDPGKWQVYKHIGAQELLGSQEAHVVFIWDPDGDRFNIITTAPAELRKQALRYGLETEHLDDQRILVYFKPNQIYFLLTAFRVDHMASEGVLGSCDWTVAITFPTSRSIAEIAQRIARLQGVNVNSVLVPVGFKHFGSLVSQAEEATAEGTLPFLFTDVTGTKTNLGEKPRFLIMAEESGGAAMGTVDPVAPVSGKNPSMALKEKDGMQVGITTLALMAELFDARSSFAERYVDLMERHNISNCIYQRKDITLYDESLTGDARAVAKEEADVIKNQFVSWFRNLTTLSPVEATAQLRTKTSQDFPALIRAIWAGDGTFLEFEEGWFEIRASGTDAVLRFYFEGRDPLEVEKRNSQLVGIRFS
ncbi:hypothetical protein KKF84_12470 [Myxococcota bacterium]|nr:hypothetical protein [Myxococcota bacterium]MBU1536130.1 hypothetical protein [Myxococcota bacterium]